MKRTLFVVPTGREYKVFKKELQRCKKSLPFESEILCVPPGLMSADCLKQRFDSGKKIEQVILLGTAGSLQSTLKRGDIFIASELLSTENDRITLDNPLPFSLQQATFLTSPAPIFRRSEKQKWSESAQAVEMEGYYLAGLCRDRSVPFCMVRIIADDFGHFGLIQYVLYYKQCVKRLSEIVLDQLRGVA